MGYMHQLWSVWGWSGHLRLCRLRIPTLVLHGDSDPLVPVLNARFMAALIPQAELRLVSGGGHLILFDDPAVAGGAITSFLGPGRLRRGGLRPLIRLVWLASPGADGQRATVLELFGAIARERTAADWCSRSGSTLAGGSRPAVGLPIA